MQLAVTGSPRKVGVLCSRPDLRHAQTDEAYQHSELVCDTQEHELRTPSN